MICECHFKSKLDKDKEDYENLIIEYLNTVL